MTLSTIERASAALQEEVNGQWRDWTNYIQAHLALLDARAAERRVVFERDVALEERVRAARTTLATLPPARRSLFDQLREERRQAVQAEREGAEPGRRDEIRLLDPDVVERQALELLLREAEGANDSEGWGVVPIREGSEVKWYEVNTAGLRAAPNAATYALHASQSESMRSRYVMAGLLAGAGALFLLVWFLWPRGDSRSGAVALAGPQANGVALSPWPIVAVVVEGPEQGPLTLPVQANPSTVRASERPAAAIWYPEHLAPLRLCLPADVLAGARSVTLLSGEGQPDRIYAMGANEAQSADLLLEPCDGNAPSRTATLQDVRAQTDAALGAVQALPDGTEATLTSIQILGPGDDPGLPSGQASVTLQVRATITDWPAVAPTLLLASGEAMLPAEPPTHAGGQATLRYLIPLPTADTPIAWSLTPPGTSRPVRWRAVLAAPPNRAAVLREALAVTELAPELRDSTLALTLTIRNQRRLSLVLTGGDFQLTRGTSAEPLTLTLPDPSVLVAPLASGATRTLTLTAQLRSPLADPLTLSVGANRFRLSLAD